MLAGKGLEKLAFCSRAVFSGNLVSQFMINDLYPSLRVVRSRQFNCIPQSGSISQDLCGLLLSQAKVRPHEANDAHKETFWMACDRQRTNAGRVRSFSHPRQGWTGSRKLAFGDPPRYQHIIGDNEDILEVRCIFVELLCFLLLSSRMIRKLHTRCASRGETAIHEEAWQAEGGRISTNLKIRATAHVSSSRTGPTG